jgi:hypothetical protein
LHFGSFFVHPEPEVAKVHSGLNDSQSLALLMLDGADEHSNKKHSLLYHLQAFLS